jgi:hypothetical protein
MPTVYAHVKKGEPFTEESVNATNRHSLDYYYYLHSNGSLSISYAHGEIPVKTQISCLEHFAGEFREIKIETK